MWSMVIDEPAKLTAAAVIENAASPAETVTFSAAATVVVIVSTAVSLVTENPNAFAPEVANTTVSEVVEWFLTVTAASVATMSGTTDLHMRRRNPIAAQISD